MFPKWKLLPLDYVLMLCNNISEVIPMPMRIKELRTRKGLSVREAAKQLGLAPSTYHNYETGERDPNSEMLIKLANFYGCSIDYMIGNEVRYRDESTEIADQITRNPELRSVFRQLSGASSTQIQKIGEIIETLKK